MLAFYHPNLVDEQHIFALMRYLYISIRFNVLMLLSGTHENLHSYIYVVFISRFLVFISIINTISINIF